MAFEVVFSPSANHDFSELIDHLEDSYVEFGEAPEQALLRAVERVESIRAECLDLGKRPKQGTWHKRFQGEVRNVSKNGAVIWFEVLETPRVIRILGIFFGGQDHIRHMLKRLA